MHSDSIDVEVDSGSPGRSNDAAPIGIGTMPPS
jgi:hypothetical protein